MYRIAITAVSLHGLSANYKSTYYDAHICARRGDIWHRIGYYRTLTIPCIAECTSFDNRSWGTAEQGAGARVLQSGSSKAVDQGNLEASRRLSTVFGVIYVVTYLDQYPTYMFEHRYMLHQGGARTPRLDLSRFPLSLSPRIYPSPSRSTPFTNMYTAEPVRTTCLISEANSVVSGYRMISTQSSSSVRDRKGTRMDKRSPVELHCPVDPDAHPFATDIAATVVKFPIELLVVV